MKMSVPFYGSIFDNWATEKTNNFKIKSISFATMLNAVF